MDYGRITSVIKRLSKLAFEIRNGSCHINELWKEVNEIDSSLFRKHLPTSTSKSPVYSYTIPVDYADIYRDRNLHTNIFGLRRVGSSIPLHDHPDMHACLKVIKGSVKIKSFTILENPDEQDEDVMVRFDGERIVSHRDKVNSVLLGPKDGNIHEIVAVEDNSFFLDVFVPGYEAKCNYYGNCSNYTMGSKIMLRRIDTPITFHCEPFPYPRIDLR